MGHHQERRDARGAAVVALAEGLLDGRIDGPAFEREFLDHYRRGARHGFGRFNDTIETMWGSVEAYTTDPELHDPELGIIDLDEQQLRDEVAAILSRDGIRPSAVQIPDHLLDPFTAATRRLIDYVRHEHDDRALVTVDGDEVVLRPRHGDGIVVGWDDYSENLVAVEIGSHHFTLHRHRDQVDYLRDIVDAAIAGRIVELRGPGRSRLLIPRRDGTTARETGYSILLVLVPIPGWHRRAHRTTFAPYLPVPS